MKKSLSLFFAAVLIAIFSSLNESPYLVLHIDKTDPPPVIIFIPSRIVPSVSITSSFQIENVKTSLKPTATNLVS